MIWKQPVKAKHESDVDTTQVNFDDVKAKARPPAGEWQSMLDHWGSLLRRGNSDIAFVFHLT